MRVARWTCEFSPGPVRCFRTGQAPAQPRSDRVDGRSRRVVPYLSVVTGGEIQKGISQLGHRDRQASLREWLQDAVVERFSNRLLMLDADIMLSWGHVLGEQARRLRYGAMRRPGGQPLAVTRGKPLNPPAPSTRRPPARPPRSSYALAKSVR